MKLIVTKKKEENNNDLGVTLITKREYFDESNHLQ